MSSESGYYRHPTISGGTIAFVSDDDLWSVSAEGGLARRLSSSPAAPSFPAFSPDGSRLAFTGRDDGPAEAYVMDARGGPPRRLTWFGAGTQVIAWSPDGARIIAATDWQQPFAGVMHAVEVPLDGGPTITLPYGPARALSFGPGGGVVIGRNSGDPARWKRYRGGTAGTIWIDRRGAGQFTPLIQLSGNLANPMWIGNRIYFLSDHEGHGNLYSCTVAGKDVRRHTAHPDFYVRFPSTDGRRIVYHAGADIHCFDPATDVTRKVDIHIHGTAPQRSRRFTNPEKYLESFDLHPAGHSLLSVHRGGLFTMGLWEGASVRLGAVSKHRHRLGAWLPDGRHVAAMTDEPGEEAIIVIALESRASRLIRGDFGRPILWQMAPGAALASTRKPPRAARKRKASAGKKTANLLALTNHRHELMLVNLDTGKVRVLDRSRHHRISGIAWSPDSRWLAYGYATSEKSSGIRLCHVATGKVTDVTRHEFFDGMPSFDPEGRYLYFISWRTFNPVYDSHYFDLGFPKGSRPYLITLRDDLASPFSAATRAPRAPGKGSEDENGKPADATARLRIDFEGITRRVIPFPVPEGRYGRILGVRGRALYSNHPVTASLGDDADSEPHDGSLHYWDFEKNKSGHVSDRVTDFRLSLDARVLGIQSGHRLRVLPATAKEDPERNRDECSRETGWIDLDRITLAVVPADEWKQMYREAWRLQREHFWRPDMLGVDWEEIYRRYLPLLDRVRSRTEFSDLMWEMQGELATSHCYEMGGDYSPRPNWRQGFLGADFAFDRKNGAWKVARIPEGDSWALEACSPLAAPGLRLRAGDEILAVGGEPLNARVSPAERLINLAGRNVEITVRRRGAGRRPAAATVTVRTLGDELPLRYRDWVERNRRLVHEKAGGRVGYLHIPDMGPRGYAEFHRHYGRESARDGLIVDVRFNRGGNVSPLLLEKLLRKRIGYDVSRWAEPTPYPDAAPMGPMVALTNEYAGSDGDIFCHAFKLSGLGPLIGKRTWGGVVGIWPRAALVDGTVTTQPEFAYWFEDVGYGVENYGADPDIEIDIRPQDYAAGRDPQLERGLEEVEKIMRRTKPLRPDVGGIKRR